MPAGDEAKGAFQLGWLSMTLWYSSRKPEDVWCTLRHEVEPQHHL